MDRQVHQRQPHQDLVRRPAHHQQVIFRGTPINLPPYYTTLLTTFFPSLPVTSNGQCITTYEVGTPKKGTMCVFPFKWKSQSFSGCTTEGDPDGKKWCSTKTDTQGAHVKGNWGYCDDSKCRDRSKDPENCRTTFEVEAPSRGLPCVFPFKHDKKTFYECTDHKDPQGKINRDILETFFL